MQDVLNNLAVAESRQGKWREAAVHWQRAQQLEPGHAGYWFNFAIGALRAGEWNSAVRGLRESVRLNAEDSEARALLIAVLRRSGRATEADSEREACAAGEDCQPTAAVRAIWKTPQAPASPEALARLDRLSVSPEFFVRQRESLPAPAAAAPRSSTGGRQ
jgi:tetratricopeptide (TPR) repeat protein